MADINVTLVISDGITVDVAVGTGGGSATDELVKYDAGDVAAGYLSAKVIAGLGISLAEGIGVDADKLVVTSTAVGTDEKVKYDAGDITAGYFSDKIVAGTGIGIAEGAGVDENKSVITNSDRGSAAVSGHNIAFNHANIHANTLDHTQGTDQGLDTGGLNAVTVVDVKDAVTKKHASGSDNETASSIINLGIDEIEFALIKSYMI